MWSLYQQDRQGAGLLIDEEGKQVEIFSRRWKIISKRDVNDADTGDMRTMVLRTREKNCRREKIEL